MGRNKPEQTHRLQLRKDFFVGVTTMPAAHAQPDPDAHVCVEDETAYRLLQTLDVTQIRCLLKDKVPGGTSRATRKVCAEFIREYGIEKQDAMLTRMGVCLFERVAPAVAKKSRVSKPCMEPDTPVRKARGIAEGWGILKLNEAKAIRREIASFRSGLAFSEFFQVISEFIRFGDNPDKEVFFE